VGMDHAVDINTGQGRSVRYGRIFCLDPWWSPAAWMNFLLQCNEKGWDV
jgi:hypothetical protein